MVGLGLDISSEAGRYAARRWPSLAFATVDLWREWPIRDAAVDLVVSVVAPKNFAETARVKFEGMPGLRSKTFTLNPAKREAANVYVWDSEHAAKAFLRVAQRA